MTVRLWQSSELSWLFSVVEQQSMFSIAYPNGVHGLRCFLQSMQAAHIQHSPVSCFFLLSFFSSLVLHGRSTCGKNMHIACMLQLADFQTKDNPDKPVTCPLCRQVFGTKQVRLAYNYEPAGLPRGERLKNSFLRTFCFGDVTNLRWVAQHPLI